MIAHMQRDLLGGAMHSLSMTGLRAIGQIFLNGFRLGVKTELSEYLTDMSGLPGVREDDPERHYKHAWAHCAARWTQFGHPTFELTRGLTSALLLTDMRGQRGLRTPFPSFAIVLPSPSPILFSGKDGVTPTAARMIWVHQFMAATERPAGPMNQVLHVTEARLWPSKRWSFVCAVADGDVALHRHMAWPADDEPLEPWIYGTDKTGNNMDDAAYTSMFRLLTNMCEYINTLPPDHPYHAAQRKSGDSDGRTGKPLPNRFVLGREIKLPSALHAAAEAVASGSKAKHRLHSRFTVRGHFRNQACGKGRADRKPIWIAPFWKGPVTADGLARLYAVDKAAIQ